MIDTHCHLSKRFAQEVDLSKLDWVVLSASSVEDSTDNLELTTKYKKIKPAVGIHPQEVEGKTLEQIQKWINWLDKLASDNKEKVIAIGECGLEFTDGVDKKLQEILFRGQIAISLKYKKPLIVHSRETSDETIAILKSYQGLRGVIHCYTGGKKRVKKFLEISDDWFFGIDGNLTYEPGLVEVVKMIPKDKLILETDSPFLAPVPHRGETNRPEWVEFTYKKVAEIWELSFDKTEKIVDENAKRLFEK